MDLPSLEPFREQVAGLEGNFGWDCGLFKSIAAKLEAAPELKRNGTLCFHEMSISKKITFDKDGGVLVG